MVNLRLICGCSAISPDTSMCRTQQKSQSVKSVTYLQNTNSPSYPASLFTGALSQLSPQKVLLARVHLQYLLPRRSRYSSPQYIPLCRNSLLIKSISVSSQTLKTRQRGGFGDPVLSYQHKRPWERKEKPSSLQRLCAYGNARVPLFFLILKSADLFSHKYAGIRAFDIMRGAISRGR